MKKQIRRGVFETNSSSVHSLTMCSNEEYDKWKKGEVLFWEWDEKFATREEIIEELKKNSWCSDVNWDDEDKVNNIFQIQMLRPTKNSLKTNGLKHLNSIIQLLAEMKLLHLAIMEMIKKI